MPYEKETETVTNFHGFIDMKIQFIKVRLYIKARFQMLSLRIINMTINIFKSKIMTRLV